MRDGVGRSSDLLSCPAAGLAVALAAGIVLADARAWPAWAGWALLAAGCGWLGWAQRARRGRGLAAHVVMVAVGWLALAGRAPPPDSEPEDGWPAEALWRVRCDGPVCHQVDERGRRWVLEAALVARREGDRWRRELGRVRLWLPAVAQAPARGDTVEVRLRLRRWQPGVALGPGAWGDRLRRTRVSHVAHVASAWAQVGAGHGFWHRLDVGRRRASVALWARLPGEQAALAQALALGDPAALGSARREAWAVAGMAHLLCVSGLHVGLVASLFYGLARLALALLIWSERVNQRRLAAYAALPAVALYALVCGAPLAATRAALMVGLGTVALALGRPQAAANGLAWAAWCILWATPEAAWMPSFWLSFGAVAALLAVAGGPGREGMEDDAPASWTGRLVRHLSAALRASTAATLATLPVTAWAFHQVAWVGLFSNLVAVPLATWVATPLALWLALAANLAPGADALLGWPSALLSPALAALDWLAGWAARLPGAWCAVPAPNAAEAAAYAALMAGLLARLRAPGQGGRALHAVLAAAVLALVGSAAVRVAARFRGDGHLHVMHLPVGQGDSTLLVSPRGGTMLIDGGGSLTAGGWDPGAQVVAPALRAANIRRLDMMVLTHPHPDHMGGLHYVARHWQVGCLVHGGGAQLSGQRALIAAVAGGGGQVRTVAELPGELGWSGLVLRFLHPRAAPHGVHPGWSLNDNSVVLRVEHGARSALLTGDIEARAEALLVGQLMPADVLKVAHHGSRTSSTRAFLAAVRPQIATILAGPHNVFGFPDPLVSMRLGEVGATVLGTHELGLIHLRSDGHRWMLPTGPALAAGRPADRP